MSQCCRESGASGLAQCRAATHLQFLRDTESVKHHKIYSAPVLLHFKKCLCTRYFSGFGGRFCNTPHAPSCEASAQRLSERLTKR